VWGETWLGPLGLLQRLETELGLLENHPSSIERAGALIGELASSSGWWRESFDADPIGTAQRMLRDRDMLALWGWKGEPASERLAELWRATSAAAPGLPERLRNIGNVLASRRADISRITMMSPLQQLAPLWRRVFSMLAETGAVVEEAEPAAASSAGDLASARALGFRPAGDGSLCLVRPYGPLVAADDVAAALAALPSLDGVLVIGADSILDEAFQRHGLPSLGTSDGAPASTSLVRLIIEAAFEPMDPGHLHALLCVSPGPIPRRVASGLIEALCESPGRGAPQWSEAMAEGLARCGDEWRPEAAARTDTFLVPAARAGEVIAAGEIVRRLDALAAWANAGRVKTPTLAATFYLAQAAAALLKLSEDNTFSLNRLRRLCDELDEPTWCVSTAGVGVAHVANPGAVLAPADTIIWWGFTRDSAPASPRLRLSNAERDKLHALGVTPPDLGRMMESEAARWRRPLDMAVKHLVLVCPETDETGDRGFPHPLWDELRAAMPEPNEARLLESRRLKAPCVAARTTATSRALPAPRTMVKVERQIPSREYESPSSLEKLISCPLAYTLNYHGKLRAGRSSGPRAPNPLLYGKLAHALLALVFESGPLPPAEAEARARAVVDTKLPGLCESLELPRYQVERTALKQAIVKTARELAAWLQQLGAKTCGVEQQLTGTLEGLPFEGKVDLLVSGPDVIVDLKWGRTTQQKKLLSGTALQLVVYAELRALTGGRPQVAYMTLRNQELIGPAGTTLPDTSVVGTTPSSDTWQGALATLGVRKQQLKQGVLHAPSADGTEIKPALVNGQLVIAPDCKYCQMSGLCGQGGCT
jgi:hypothetical protein